MSTIPSPHTPLTAELLLIRQQIMSGNGINIIYPLGRDHGISYPGSFPSYDGFAASVFGYVVYPGTVCEFGLTGNRGGFVLLKTAAGEKAVAVVRADNSSTIYFGDGGSGYGYGRQYLFRFRAAYDPNVDRRALKDPIIAGVVTMEVGSYAVYEGIYSGSDAIGINAPGAVRDLGKPQTSGVTVRIGVRKNLTMYVFLADYGTAPVSAPFSELLMSGHYYVPRFTPNFNVRRVQIETYY
ncbi:uncharacterized protein [Dermacentor andersoni]|uniref:uncharacterized protein isoform X2 n=1 Tax=Dermacentor andersoni TaxID=34620 RepID=UPI002417C8DA|nr:uncharacterized protein LOC129384945 isoform X2 [Dermacentor andersoni]